MRKISQFLSEYGMPKKLLAERIGIHPSILHFYLDPIKYRNRPVSENTLRKIAAFEGRSLEVVRDEYESRRGAA